MDNQGKWKKRHVSGILIILDAALVPGVYSQGQETGLLDTSSRNQSPLQPRLWGEEVREDMIPISLSPTPAVKIESDFLHQDCCHNKVECDFRHLTLPPHRHSFVQKLSFTTVRVQGLKCNAY